MRSQARGEKTPRAAALRLLQKYCAVAPAEPQLEAKERGRFKVLAQIRNLEEVNISGIAKGYNGKPALINKTGKHASRALLRGGGRIIILSRLETATKCESDTQGKPRERRAKRRVVLFAFRRVSQALARGGPGRLLHARDGHKRACVFLRGVFFIRFRNSPVGKGPVQNAPRASENDERKTPPPPLVKMAP